VVAVADDDVVVEEEAEAKEVHVRQDCEREVVVGSGS